MVPSLPGFMVYQICTKGTPIFLVSGTLYHLWTLASHLGSYYEVTTVVATLLIYSEARTTKRHGRPTREIR